MVTFAIVGCGRIGTRHASHISKVGKLVAVCDIDRQAAKNLGEEFGAISYFSLEELLREQPDIDVISVCTPNGLHATHTIQALKQGFHVLCEKPMALSTYDAGEMIKAAETANRRLFIIKQNRFNPPVAAVKQAIDGGKLGKILSVHLSCFWNRNASYYDSSEWKGSKKLDGGTLFTQFSHFIDLLYWMIGDVDEVQAYLNNFIHKELIEFEDNGVVALRFSSGALGTIHYTINSYKKNMEGSLTIFGEKGTVKIGGQYLNELEYQCIEDFEISDLPDGNPANNYGEYVGSMSNHDKVYENIVDVLENGASINTNNYEGLKTVEIIEKIYNQASQYPLYGRNTSLNSNS